MVEMIPGAAALIPRQLLACTHARRTHMRCHTCRAPPTPRLPLCVAVPLPAAELVVRAVVSPGIWAPLTATPSAAKLSAIAEARSDLRACRLRPAPASGWTPCAVLPELLRAPDHSFFCLLAKLLLLLADISSSRRVGNQVGGPRIPACHEQRRRLGCAQGTGAGC